MVPSGKYFPAVENGDFWIRGNRTLIPVMSLLLELRNNFTAGSGKIIYIPLDPAHTLVTQVCVSASIVTRVDISTKLQKPLSDLYSPRP